MTAKMWGRDSLAAALQTAPSPFFVTLRERLWGPAPSLLIGEAHLLGPLHIPLPVLFAAPLFIEAQDKDIVPLRFELIRTLLEVAAAPIRHGAVALDQHRLVVGVIRPGHIAFLQP